MAVDILDNPESTGYEYFKQLNNDIRYVRFYGLDNDINPIIKKAEISYPQARKNKRENFKIK